MAPAGLAARRAPRRARETEGAEPWGRAGVAAHESLRPAAPPPFGNFEEALALVPYDAAGEVLMRRDGVDCRVERTGVGAHRGR